MVTNDDERKVLIEQKIDNIEKSFDAESKREEAEFRENMKDRTFRIKHYTYILDREYVSIPNDNFFSAEAEQITKKYKECKEKLQNLNTEEELQAVVDEFLAYKKSRVNAKVVGTILISSFAILFIGFILYCVLKGNNII